MILDLQHVTSRPRWFKKQNVNCKPASILLKTAYLKNILLLVKELKNGVFSEKRYFAKMRERLTRVTIGLLN